MKISWHVGADIDWAFTYLAEHIVKATPEYDHIFNERGDIDVVMTPVFLQKLKPDRTFLLHLDGNRFYEARGVEIHIPEPKPEAAITKPRVIALIWEKDRWSWGIIYQEIHNRLADEFDFVALEFESYRKRRAWIPCSGKDFFFCQNVTQLGSVPEENKRHAIVRLGGIMNFTGNEAVDQMLVEMGKCGAIIATNHRLYEIGKTTNPNTYLIPNGIDMDVWKPAEGRRWHTDQPTIGFIGNISTKAKSQYKGYPLVARVCRDMKLELRQAIYKHQQIPHDKMQELFWSQIDIFILPTDGEGCSNSLMEALACGVPIITTRTAGFHGELLTDGKDVIFCEKTLESVTESIKRFIADPGLFRRLSQGGREFAKRHHDIKIVAEKYREVFKKHFVKE